jgi:hypothetical protein
MEKIYFTKFSKEKIKALIIKDYVENDKYHVNLIQRNVFEITELSNVIIIKLKIITPWLPI